MRICDHMMVIQSETFYKILVNQKFIYIFQHFIVVYILITFVLFLQFFYHFSLEKILQCRLCYQTLINYIFVSYLGVFVYIYLDDSIIFLASIKYHINHIRILFYILRKEKLYLSPLKMQFFAEELKILGHIINDNGI